ncbi:potassium-transporting ATPase subunit F [Entomomonas moraniae]|uniref:Potassium-transporting ATPase subunit F n=1 Tax=Entomomonas moraniae TaxID=2213226 RepID=A0A3S9XAN6_9GAMM|nr:potassium-transporting ATPase subunit F [Entomomonas moraniae]
MSILLGMALLLAISLLGYLIYVLYNAEDF